MSSLTLSDNDIKNHILHKLKTIEKENKIKILYAVESGSRVWGFPSPNSDYDVRFIYCRHQNEYLSIINPSNDINGGITFDKKLNTELDINGWDIRKTLELTTISNVTLVEWMSSDVCYIKDPYVFEQLRVFLNKSINFEILSYHYKCMGYQVWKNICSNLNEVKIKDYCYSLRSAFCFIWVLKNRSIPPINIRFLIEGLDFSYELKSQVNFLLELKFTSTEQTVVKHIEKLDRFLESILTAKLEKPLISPSQDLIEEANWLCRNCIKNSYRLFFKTSNT